MKRVVRKSLKCHSKMSRLRGLREEREKVWEWKRAPTSSNSTSTANLGRTNTAKSSSGEETGGEERERETPSGRSNTTVVKEWERSREGMETRREEEWEEKEERGCGEDQKVGREGEEETPTCTKGEGEEEKRGKEGREEEEEDEEVSLTVGVITTLVEELLPT